MNATTFLAENNVEKPDSATLQTFTTLYAHHNVEELTQEGHRFKPVFFNRKLVLTTAVVTLRVIANRWAKTENTPFTIGKSQWADQQGTWYPAWLYTTIPAATQTIILPHATTPNITSATILTADYVTLDELGNPETPFDVDLCQRLAEIAEVIALRRMFPDALKELYLSEELIHRPARRWQTSHPPKDPDPLVDGIIDLLHSKSHPSAQTQHRTDENSAKLVVAAIREYEQIGGETSDLLRMLRHIDAHIFFTTTRTLNIPATVSQLTIFQINVVRTWLKRKTRDLLRTAKTQLPLQ